MEVHLNENESFESLIRRFSKKVEKDDIIKIHKNNLAFEPKSVKRQQQKKNKLRKSRETSRENNRR
jgi:ribosomal protein S21